MLTPSEGRPEAAGPAQLGGGGALWKKDMDGSFKEEESREGEGSKGTALAVVDAAPIVLGCSSRAAASSGSDKRCGRRGGGACVLGLGFWGGAACCARGLGQSAYKACPARVQVGHGPFRSVDLKKQIPPEKS